MLLPERTGRALPRDIHLTFVYPPTAGMLLPFVACLPTLFAESPPFPTAAAAATSTAAAGAQDMEVPHPPAHQLP